MPSWADQVQAIASIVGVTIAIVGFIFVSYQIRQVSQSNRASAHTAIFSHSLELTRLMMENPEVRPYLSEGKDLIREDPLYDKVILICEMFADFYEHVSLQRENLPEQSRGCWDKAIAHRYQRNSALKRYIEAHRSVYAPSLLAAIERGSLPSTSSTTNGR
jgi:hypothetical protein